MNKVVLGTSLLALSVAHANAELQQSESQKLDSFVIQGTDFGRYEADSSSSATGFEADLIDVPRSVQVIPEQLMLDQQVNELADVLRNVSSVSPSDGFGGTNDDFYIRGFRRNGVYVDGVREDEVSIKHNTFGMERIEVLKGPASVLYGQTSPGGTVNMISKKPEAETRRYIEVIGDEHGKRQVQLDLNGAADDAGDVLVRLIALKEDSETFRKTDEFVNTERDYIAPALSWQIDDKNSLYLKYEYMDESRPSDRGLVLDTTQQVADIPVERRLGESVDLFNYKEDRLTALFEHRFSDDWKISNRLIYQQLDQDDYQTRPLAGITDPTDLTTATLTGVSADNGLLIRRADGNDKEVEVWANTLTLTGTHYTGDIEHQLVAGLDFRYLEKDHDFLLALTQLGGPVYQSDLTLINVFDPVYSGAKNRDRISNTKEETTEKAVFFQDLMSVSDHLKVMAGARYDHFDVELDVTDFYTLTNNAAQLYTLNGMPVNTVGEQSEGHLSPNLGVVYQFDDEVALFAGYSESFEKNIQQNFSTGEFVALEPEMGKQIEVGVKTALMDGKLNLTSSVYRIVKENVALQDGTELRAAGEVESKGFELDLNMQVVEGMNMVASYGYTDAEVTEDTSFVGNRPENVAKHTASLWGSYEFKQGDFKGLGLGAGAFYMGDRYGEANNNWELDGYTTFDASVWYYMPIGNNSQLKLRAGVKNITDERYFTAANSSFRISVGQPRTFFASAAVEF